MIEKVKLSPLTANYSELACAEKINELISFCNEADMWLLRLRNQSENKPTLKDLLTDEVIDKMFPYTYSVGASDNGIRFCRNALKKWRDEQ